MKVTLLLLVLLLIPVIGFASGTKKEAVAKGELGPPGQFPLKEKITLKAGHWARQSPMDPTNNPLVLQWEKDTNIHLDWITIENEEKRNILFASDDYPDMSMADGVWKSVIAQWLKEGVVRDLKPYLNQGYTPNLDRIYKKHPNSLAYALNPEGKLPSLARFLMLESNYLEQNFMINKKWLDNLGLSVPKTTADLKKVLLAFRDKDPNGNGKNDELPFGFVATDGFAQHLQSMYGMWGMPTKNGIAIKDGKCYFAPMQPAFKDFINFMADLYAAKLIDPESFVMKRHDFDAKVDDPTGNKYGFVIAQRGYTSVDEKTKNRSDFVSIPPLTPPGYKPEMWVHPGRLAIKNVWIMTDKNAYPEHTMAWIDRMYSLEASVQAQFGILGQGVVKQGDMYVPQNMTVEDRQKIGMPGAFPGIFEEDDFGKRIKMDKSTKFLYDNYYTYYVKYKAKEQWVRAEFTADEQKEVSTLKGDINKLWKSSQARWITGSADVNAEWGGYVQKMKQVKIDRYVELHQAAHDRFLKAIGDFR